MSGCMAAGKPRISILMAVYEPRMDWLREQLLSLDGQTYPNLKLYIRDDCSPTVPFERVRECVEDCIHSFPYEIGRNEENLGSNKTFELLTREADGAYFAYCDQDDVWLPEKLSILEAQLSGTSAGLVCGDVALIDEKGGQLAGSITGIRPRHVFRQGEGLAPYLIYRNFVIGCTTLVRRACAVNALPFARHMVHDHYLAFFCALNGPIALCPERLVRYRIHEGNQTGVLSQVTDPQTYRVRHLTLFCDRVEELRARFSLPELERAARWAEARKRNAARQPGGMRELWGLREVNRTTTVFELVALRLPGPLFRLLLKAIQEGKL